MTEILILTAEDEPNLPGLEALPETVQLSYARNESALRDGLQRADIFLVTDFRAGMIERCWPEQTTVRWVHATSAGVDGLMFPALQNSAIPLTNARGVFNRGIAEYVLGAVLMFAKDTLGNLRNQRLHRWQHRETHLIQHKRVLLVGAGSIGATVAELLSAAGLDVIGTARRARDVPGFRAVYAQDQLPRLLPEADYVVITAPLTPETEGLFNADAFAAMKPSAHLINVGRGPIVRSNDLLDALDKGALAGAALDVFEEEPLPKNHPLWDHPKVMVSAHMAGDFIGWRQTLGEQFVDNFIRWQADEPLFNRVTKTPSG